jgi:hypothetical protein
MANKLVLALLHQSYDPANYLSNPQQWQSTPRSLRVARQHPLDIPPALETWGVNQRSEMRRVTKRKKRNSDKASSTTKVASLEGS